VGQVSNLPQTQDRLETCPTKQRLSQHKVAHRAGMGRRKQPLLRGSREAGTDRVLLDVPEDALQFAGIEDTVVVRLVLPKGALATEEPITFQPRMPFQAVHDSFPWRSHVGVGAETLDPGFQWPEYPVKMARHYHVRQQVVTNAGEVIQRVLDLLGQSGVVEVPHPGSLIQPRVGLREREFPLLVLPLALAQARWA
jgi:hypothetical protein